MKKRPSPIDTEWAKDIAEAVYRDRLGPGEAEKMITGDKDQGQKLRARAQCYAPLVAAFARALGVEPRRMK